MPRPTYIPKSPDYGLKALGEILRGGVQNTAADVIGGWGAILDPSNANAIVEGAREKFGYTPTSEGAIRFGEDLSTQLEPITSSLRTAADTAGEVSPLLGAAVATAPAALTTVAFPEGRGVSSALRRTASPASQEGVFKLLPRWDPRTEEYYALKAQHDTGQRRMTPEQRWERLGVAELPGTGQLVEELPDINASISLERFGNPYNRELLSGPAWGNAGKWGNAPATMEDIYSHPELYKEYPRIKQATARPVGVEEYKAGVRGGFYPEQNVYEGWPGLFGNKKEQAALRDTLVHETQHGIQYTEGMPRGGSPEEWDYSRHVAEAKAAGANINDILTTMRKDYPGMTRFQQEGIVSDLRGGNPEYGLASTPINDERLRQFQSHPRSVELMNELQRYEEGARNEAIALRNYRNLHGEAMARLAQERKDLTPAQLKQRYPFGEQYFREATGSPLEDLIIRRHDYATSTR